MTITRAGVDADYVAGHEFESFKRQRVRSIGALCPWLVKQANLPHCTTIYRIMEMNIMQSKLSCSLDPKRDFLNGIGAVITTRSIDGYLGRLRLVGGNEIVLREPNRLAFVHRSHMVGSVLLHANSAVIFVAVATGELNRLAIIKSELSILQRMIHFNFKSDIRSFNR